MTEKLTRIRLHGRNGRYGLMDWGEHSFEDMHQQIIRYATDLRETADAILSAKQSDFDVAVVRGAVVQHHVRDVMPVDPTP